MSSKILSIRIYGSIVQSIILIFFKQKVFNQINFCMRIMNGIFELQKDIPRTIESLQISIFFFKSEYLNISVLILIYKRGGNRKCWNHRDSPELLKQIIENSYRITFGRNTIYDKKQNRSYQNLIFSLKQIHETTIERNRMLFVVLSTCSKPSTELRLKI